MNHFVRRWGNSKAVRLPASALSLAGLDVDDRVDIRAEAGRIVIEKRPPDKPTLEELVEGITPGNLHQETDWGPAVGKEAW